MATQIEYPKVCVPGKLAVADTLPPRTLLRPGDEEYWDLSLEEAFKIALANSAVLRDAGGRLLDAPAAAPTRFDPAIFDSDPRGGTEAALSEFDAQLALSMMWYKDDRVYNSALTESISGTSAERALGQLELSKTTATGTKIYVRNITDYVQFNSLFTRFPSAYNTIVETEIRHPILQGAGLAFNRIAGPNAAPGVYNGVVLARINTDVSLADLERAVINLARDVEQSYWALYAGYRDLDARVAARNSALQTWRSTRNRLEAGAGDVEEESTAREQYWLLQAQVDNALSGSTTYTAGFLSPAPGGILAREAQLRQLLGLPPNDGRLIRPADEPSTVLTVWDWDQCVREALTRRVELRRQRWIIKRREMELIASRNFLLPRLDGVAQYRWFGFGDDLFAKNDTPFSGAWDTLADGNFQEWELGFQYSVPVGKRLGHTGVRNAELQLARDRAILRDQESLVVYQLGDALAQLDRTYQLSRASYNRLEAARKTLAEVQKKYDAGWGIVTLDRLLQAIQRVAETEVDYYRYVVDYNLGIVNMYASRGALLDYSQVSLSEGPWPTDAYNDVDIHSAGCGRRFNYCLEQPCNVSAGAYDQHQYASPIDSEDLTSEEVRPTPSPGPTTTTPDSTTIETPAIRLPDVTE
ncbi:MAG: TolC family protein [Pirellulales bacterium]